MIAVEPVTREQFFEPVTVEQCAQAGGFMRQGANLDTKSYRDTTDHADLTGHHTGIAH